MQKTSKNIKLNMLKTMHLDTRFILRTELP